MVRTVPADWPGAHSRESLSGYFEPVLPLLAITIWLNSVLAKYFPLRKHLLYMHYRSLKNITLESNRHHKRKLITHVTPFFCLPIKLNLKSRLGILCRIQTSTTALDARTLFQIYPRSSANTNINK